MCSQMDGHTIELTSHAMVQLFQVDQPYHKTDDF